MDASEGKPQYNFTDDAVVVVEDCCGQGKLAITRSIGRLSRSVRVGACGGENGKGVARALGNSNTETRF